MRIVAELTHERPGKQPFRLTYSEAEALVEAARAGQHAYSNRALGLILYCDGWSYQETAAVTGQRLAVVRDVVAAWPQVGKAVLGARA